jgi:hypothetical protein
MRKAGVLGERSVTPLALAAIATEEGAGEQASHQDFAPAQLQKWHATHNVPLSAIAASDQSFTVGTTVKDYREIVVRPGYMLVMRGDFFHQGGPHTSDRLRLHAYVRPKGCALPLHLYIRS